MIKLGYKLISEEHGPTELVRNLVRAEQAGFDLAAISDHFSPWVEEQGHAPLAWSMLGGLAHADPLSLLPEDWSWWLRNRPSPEGSLGWALPPPRSIQPGQGKRSLALG